MSDAEALSCPMRRLGASRMPAWAVAEFAGAEACAALCLASREWDAAVASSPLWAARVRRAAPLTFHALCAARHPMAAAESVARIPFDRDAPFALEFAAAQPGQRRASVITVEDLDSVFFHYALARSTGNSVTEYKALHSPLYVAIAPNAALETAPVPSAFAAAVNGEISVEMRARAAQGLGRSAAMAAAAMESGNWRAVAALLPALRELPFGPVIGKKKNVTGQTQEPSHVPPSSTRGTAGSHSSPDTITPTVPNVFYPLAGAPKSAAIIEATTDNAGAHVADEESAAQYALKTTPMSVGYCRTEKEMAKIRQGRCGQTESNLRQGKCGETELPNRLCRKIVVLGAQGTGKTTFTCQLKVGEVIETIPTIGFNVESCGSPRQLFEFDLWDIGGHFKLRPQWGRYYSGTHGLVFFVESTSLFHVYEGRENFKRAAVEFIGAKNAAKTALTVVCTKQDLPGAVLPEAVAAAFMSITLAELPTATAAPSEDPEMGDQRKTEFFRHNAGGPLLSQFATWRFVGCNALSRTSCVNVAGIIEDDLESLLP